MFQKIYSLQVNLGSGNDVYNLLEEKVDLTKQKEISFVEEELAKLSFEFDQINQVKIENAQMCKNVYSGPCGTMFSPSGIENIYASKKDYNNLSFSMQVENDWKYEYRKENFNVTNDQTIPVGHQLKANLEFYHDSYTGGQRISLQGHEWGDGVLQVTDQYGNKLSSLRYQNERILGLLTFKKGKEIYQVEVNNLSYPSMILPNAEGTFEVTFTLGDQTKIPADNYKIWDFQPDVPVNKDWTVEFNLPVTKETAGEQNIFVTDKDGNIHPVAYSVDGTKVNIKPNSNYTKGEIYVLWIKDVKDATGKDLKENIKMEFTIAE